MTKVKNILIGVFAIAALFSGRPVAAGSGEPTLAAGACFSLDAQAPEPIFQTEDGCYNQSFCPNDDYCWQICSIALTANCVNNVCQYTFSNPPPPPGGCPEQRFCADGGHCVFPGGITGSCINNVCVC